MENFFVVFDLDGTLSNLEHRLGFIANNPKNWDSFFLACDEDEPIPEGLEMLRACVTAGFKVEIWTGRSEIARAKTEQWLYLHGVSLESVELVMRPADYKGRDDKLKPSWIKERGRPNLVIDDRSTVVEAFRALGIPCWQVAEGNF